MEREENKTHCIQRRMPEEFPNGKLVGSLKQFLTLKCQWLFNDHQRSAPEFLTEAGTYGSTPPCKTVWVHSNSVHLRGWVCVSCLFLSGDEGPGF